MDINCCVDIRKIIILLQYILLFTHQYLFYHILIQHFNQLLTANVDVYFPLFFDKKKLIIRYYKDIWNEYSLRSLLFSLKHCFICSAVSFNTSLCRTGAAFNYFAPDRFHHQFTMIFEHRKSVKKENNLQNSVD